MIIINKFKVHFSEVHRSGWNLQKTNFFSEEGSLRIAFSRLSLKTPAQNGYECQKWWACQRLRCTEQQLWVSALSTPHNVRPGLHGASITNIALQSKQKLRVWYWQLSQAREPTLYQITAVHRRLNHHTLHCLSLQSSALQKCAE